MVQRNSLSVNDNGYIYIYIYIYIYLLTYYLPAFTVTKKEKKKTPEFRDNNISDHSLGEKEKKFWKKKKRPTSSHQVKKKSRDMQSVGQKNKNSQ